MPYINFKCINSNREKVAESIFCLKRLENYLYKQDPSLIKDVKDFKVIYEKGVKSDEKE